MSSMDKTWCPFYATCQHGNECNSALTREQQERADGLKIHLSQFAFPPTCWKPIKTKSKRKEGL